MPPAAAPRDPMPGAPAGLADHPLAEVRQRVLRPWDELLAVAETCDHSVPLALRGWTARELFVHLGRWDDHQVMADLADSAAAGAPGEPADPDVVNAAVLAAHADADHGEVVEALAGSRASVVEFFDSDEVARLGHELTVSPVGRIPLLGLMQAGAFEVAVHLLDLAKVGLTAPSAQTLDAGIAALVDVTGMLLARHRLSLELTVATRGGGATRDGGWTSWTDQDGWRTEPIEPGAQVRTGVTGSAADVLLLTSGRGNVLAALAQRRMAVHGLPRLLEIAPVIEDVPGIPGRRALGTAASALSNTGRALGATGRLLGQIPGLRR